MDASSAALRIYEAINARRLDELDDVLAPDAVFHMGHVPTPVGRDEIKASMAGYVEAFPDLRLGIEEVVADGDRVAVRLVAEGTHEGTFGAVDATGRRIRVVETDFLHLSNGKVVEGWVLYDQFTLLTQLGLLPDLAVA